MILFSVESMKDCNCPVCSVILDIGSTVTLSCCDRAQINSSFKLLLRRPNQTFDDYIYNGKEFASSYKSRMTLDIDKATLLPLFRFVNVTVNDTGSYECKETSFGDSSPTTLITELAVLCT